MIQGLVPCSATVNEGHYKGRLLLACPCPALLYRILLLDVPVFTPLKCSWCTHTTFCHSRKPLRRIQLLGRWHEEIPFAWLSTRELEQWCCADHTSHFCVCAISILFSQIRPTFEEFGLYQSTLTHLSSLCHILDLTEAIDGMRKWGRILRGNRNYVFSLLCSSKKIKNPIDNLKTHARKH